MQCSRFLMTQSATTCTNFWDGTTIITVTTLWDCENVVEKKSAQETLKQTMKNICL